jgi:hypothetical protein
METSKMNTPNGGDAELEAWLKANVRVAPLADDGFSERVLAALPVSTKASGGAGFTSRNRRLILCSAGGILGLAAVALLAGPTVGADPGPYSFLQAVGLSLMACCEHLSDPLVEMGLLVTLVSFGVIYWRELRLWWRYLRSAF